MACSPACAMEFARGLRIKTEKAAVSVLRREVATARLTVKTRRQWLSECQVIVNRYVRLRDRDRPCCSCDRPASWGGQWHASHLRSVGAASAVRFHLWNIHKACSICNNHLSGNLAEYLPRIRAHLGDNKVDWLYAQNSRAGHGIEYLKRLKAVMGKKLRRLEKRHGLQG
jgi:hypothetical protein